MAIDSVGSATSTYLSQQVANNQTRQAEQVRQAEQASKPSEPRENERTNVDSEAVERQPPQPVVNAQGQMTGKVINAVA